MLDTKRILNDADIEQKLRSKNYTGDLESVKKILESNLKLKTRLYSEEENYNKLSKQYKDLKTDEERIEVKEKLNSINTSITNIKHLMQDTKFLFYIPNIPNERVPEGKTSNDNVVGKVSREVKLYTEEYHLDKKNIAEDIKERYNNLRERITGLNDVEIIPRQLYIGFKLKTNFVDVEVRPKDIKLYINMKIGELDDPKGISRDVSHQGHWGNGDYEVRINPNTDLDYVMFLINQSYNKQLNKK
jgi:predicted transport protein